VSGTDDLETIDILLTKPCGPSLNREWAAGLFTFKKDEFRKCDEDDGDLDPGRHRNGRRK